MVGINDDLWRLAPPALAILLAIATRQVFVSLFAGLTLGYLVANNFAILPGIVDTIDACVAVFADPGNTRVILFSTLVGGLIALIQRSGGVDGFVHRVQHMGLVRGPRSAGILAMAVGIATFIESSIVCLVTGAVARPLFDRLKMPREKLAYVCDTVSAPTCIMIPLNGWGAYVIAQLTMLGVDAPVPLLVRAIPMNIYAWGSLLTLLAILVSRRDFGPMARAEKRARETGKLHRDDARPMIADDVIALAPAPETPRRARNMVIPIAVMVAIAPIALAYTGYHNLGLVAELPPASSVHFQEAETIEHVSELLGQAGVEVAREATLTADGDGRWRVNTEETTYHIEAAGRKVRITRDEPVTFWNILNACSGSTAVLWAVVAAVLSAGIIYRVQGIMRLGEFIDVVFKGASALVPLAALMMLAFALGHLCKNVLGTGEYVASLVGDSLHPMWLAPAVFVTACGIAFSTGTSFGTFAIMLPIAYPLAIQLGAPPHWAVAAVLGGGVFGDHCSPISDTTIVSSMASACDHIDHVRTQLPYALFVGGITVVVYAVLGWATLGAGG